MTFSQPHLVDTGQQAKFFYSWNWINGPRTLNLRYKTNAFHTLETFNNTWSLPQASNLDLLLLPDSINYLWKPWNVHDGYQPLDALAIMWLPWLPPSSAGDDFKGFRNDKSGASLPFLQRDTTVGTLDSAVVTGETIYRWKLQGDTTQLTPVTVFSQPWLGNEFVYKDEGVGVQLESPFTNFDLYNTQRVYLSINLRRAEADTVMNDDTVLVLRAPYRTFGGASGYISFDSVPNPAILTTTTRGHIRPVQWNASPDLTTFVITRRMIPPSDSTNPDVTLYAMFFTSNDTYFHDSIEVNNPRFNFRWGGTPSGVIDTIGIEADYYPASVSVAVRWLKLETPNAQRLFFGDFDSTIIYEVNRTLDSLQVFNTVHSRHDRVFRLYGREEFLADEWLVNRYFNMLTDTLACAEYNIEHYAHERNAILFRENWQGSTFQLGRYTPAPYTRGIPSGTVEDLKHLNVAGRDGLALMDTCWCLQKKHDDYEVQFRKIPAVTTPALLYDETDILSLPLPAMSDSAYRRHIYREKIVSDFPYPSVLQAIEGHLWNGRYLSEHSFIFDNEPWWANIWAQISYDYNLINPGTADTARTMTHQWEHRPFSGEELRLSMWNSLILGAKGFQMYYGGGANGAYQHSRTGNLWDALAANSDNFKGDLSIAPVQGLLPFDYTKRDTVRITTDTSLILDDPDIGTDYLDTTGGRNDMFTFLFRRFFRYSDSTYRANMRTDSIYLGFRTTRWTIDEVYERIRRYDTTLMNLQLRSWYAKGARKNFLGDTSLFLNYIDTTRTRHIIGHPGKTPDSWDSSFYDITLHTHKFYDSNDVIFLGIQNRRTNSLLTDSVGADTVWLPTKQFNDSVALGLRQKYEQLGARRITVPFNFKDSDGRYALLRIRELGGGLDTVVGQDKEFTLDYLPGEGKFFKIEIQRSNTPTGELAYNGQTKITGHALMRFDSTTSSWIEGDTLVYYRVAHKPVVPTAGIPRTGVYFARSKPTSRWDDNANLQWEAEILLSDTVEHSGRLNIADSCAYPSIVTRFNPEAQTYDSYIVYSCLKADTAYEYSSGTNWHYIIESIVRSNDTAVAETLRGVMLDSVKTRDMAEWGTPMINASDTANFYAYSDLYRGIVVGWKKPDLSRSLADTKELRWYDNSNDFPKCYTYAQHPSLNAYGRYILGEAHSDCAVVWQEPLSCSWDARQIFYTRLRLDSGRIVHGLAPNYGPDFYITGIFNPDSTIFCASCNSSSVPEQPTNTHPVVYRELYHPSGDNDVCDTTDNNPHWEFERMRTALRFDGIYWQSLAAGGSPTSVPITEIRSRWVWSLDDFSGGSYIPDTFRIGWLGAVWSGGDPGPGYSGAGYIDQPTVSAGEYSHYPDSNHSNRGCWNFGDRVMNLDFRRRPMTVVPLVPVVVHDSAAQVLHFEHTHNWPVYHEAYSTVDNGFLSYPHLAARPSVHQYSWQENRRIYGKAESANAVPDIRSSAQYFYRRAGGGPVAVHLDGFGDDSLSYCIGGVEVNGREYRLLPRYLPPMQRVATAPDTLRTPWFAVGSSERVELYTAGNAPECLEAWIERRSDGSRWTLPLRAGEKHRLDNYVVDFINGNDEEYRVEFYGTGWQYRQETVLTEATEALERGATTRNVINLGASDAAQTLTIYPNPAADEVRIALRGEGAATIEVVNMFGEIIWKTEAMSGAVQTVRTAGFAAGAYAVRVMRAGLPAAAGRFVVAR